MSGAVGLAAGRFLGEACGLLGGIALATALVWGVRVVLLRPAVGG